MFNILSLTIKKKWFDRILSGEKKEEYREIKPFYDVRFANTLGYTPNIIKSVFECNQSECFQVKFKNGYKKDSPSFIADCRLSIDYGKEEWGAEKGKIYYVLHILKIVWKSINNIGGYLNYNFNVIQRKENYMLKIGDRVVMNDKYYVSDKNKGKEFIVITEPQDVCGTMSVWLEGFRGCYAADGLTVIS